ncbi:MAG: dicarboxylate transporter/tellurite-resistance protein TehA [Bacteroidota bacterium]
MRCKEPIAVPAAFFGIILGLAGLGNGWRVVARIWPLSPWIGEAVMALAVTVWLVLAVFYIRKWLFSRAAAVAELRHPVACGYIALVFVTTLLISVAAAPYSQPLALFLAVVGWGGNIGYGAMVTGTLWSGDRDGITPTAVIYLPTVAGNFVSAMAAGTLGYTELGMLFLGAGLLSWLAIESVLMHNLYTAGPLPHAIRPTLGIQLAPPVVCCAAYLAVNGGTPDTFAQILFGYGLLQGGVMIRLLPWFAEQDFVPGHWAFSFGVVALPLSALRMVEHGVRGPIAHVALPLFAAANVIIAYLSLRTLWLLFTGRLVPRPTA